MQDVKRLEMRPAAGYPKTFVVVFPNAAAEWQSTQGTKAQVEATVSAVRTTHGLVTTYARAFDRFFIPYHGPDEPPGFEPEDYPVR